MKKFLILSLTMLALFHFSGCVKQKEVGELPDVPEGLWESPKENTDNTNLSDPEYDWGISLSVKDVSPSGLTLVCQQSGGEVEGELDTGSFYRLDLYKDDTWQPVEMLELEGELAWTTEAWIIVPDSTTEWTVNWSWLYGELPSGTYRISKNFMHLRATGDYDTQMLSAEFEIE